MGRRTVSGHIDASPQAVFAIYTDAARFREWQPDVKIVEASGPLDQPGTSWTAEYGGAFTANGVVDAVDPPRRHVQTFREAGGLVTCTTTATFEPDDGGTRVTFDFDYTVKGGFIGRVLEGRAGQEIEARVTRDLARLGRLAESQP